MKTETSMEDITITGRPGETAKRVLTPEAIEFFGALHHEFNPRRLELLALRVERQRAIDRGEMPNFPEETQAIRNGPWRVDPVPADFQDRRVEITGPVDRKMVINALNSGASCFMADFEDAHSPTWVGTLEGQANVMDAVRGTITYTSPEGKSYKLGPRPATLIVRPRGWHLPEKHVLVNGEPASASLFDFAMYFFHNAEQRLARGSGIYLYLPKLEHYLEARLWNDVFVRAESLLGIQRGGIKATVLIEHILASFQMAEILYELRHHSAGLNCGRWDYIFSYIKKFARKSDFIVPDRIQVTMTAPFMRAYSLTCIRECHKRGAHAIGGMAAYIPIKTDVEANEIALAKVREDKLREANDGHDGTWVAHPGLVPIAKEEFDRVLGEKPNQIGRRRDDVEVTAAQLLEPPKGAITEAGLRTNIRVGIQYIEAWLGGLGCVPLYNLMEDAATSEISRAQLWQWLHHGAKLVDGRLVTPELCDRLLAEELVKIKGEVGQARFERGHFPQATEMFMRMIKAPRLDDFLTLPAYELLP